MNVDDFTYNIYKKLKDFFQCNNWVIARCNLLKKYGVTTTNVGIYTGWLDLCNICAYNDKYILVYDRHKHTIYLKNKKGYLKKYKILYDFQLENVLNKIK